MIHKTSDIYRALKAVKEKPFTRKDMTYVRESQGKGIDIRKDLLKIRPSTIWTLEKAGLIKETPQGYQLTDDGLPLLNEYEEKIKEFGISNIELIPAMKESKITYKVKVNPKAKKKIKTVKTKASLHEPSKDTEYEERKKHMTDFLIEKFRPTKGIREEENFLIVKTRIDYYRTTKERNRLNKMVEEFGMRIEISDIVQERSYDLKIDDKTPLTLVSRRKGKSLKSVEPLEIKVNLNESIETSEKLINSLSKIFH